MFKPWTRRRTALAGLIATAAVVSALAAESCRSLFTAKPALSAQQTLLAANLHEWGRPRKAAPLPEKAAVIALGLDSAQRPLQDFADRRARELKRKVITYRSFAEAQYVDRQGAWWEGSPQETTALVEQALRRAVARFPQSKIIAFNLDGFDPKRLWGPDGRIAFSYTNFEVQLLLRDQALFLATLWYLEGRELSPHEVMEFWTRPHE